MANPDKTVRLTARANGNTITIRGSGSDRLATNSGSRKYKFELDDNGLGVRFASLDTADGLNGCPQTGSGELSTQIDDVDIDPNKPLEASFKDKNDNDAANGFLNISYQWNFTCPGKTVRPFDPIISNGGKR
jgi:hypothetical protein